MTPITRVHYRERQRLRTADLATEQLYLTQARRRHTISQHRWGIVWGLALDAAKQLFVQPGIAIDGYGRELIVPDAIELSDVLADLSNEWGHPADLVDVWLVYNEVTCTPAQRGRADNCSDTRISEQACLRFTEGIQKVSAEKRRKAAYDSPEETVDFQPWQTPPDDWMNAWPVYLGQIIKKGDATTVDINNRPYAELVGERVTTPSGQGEMALIDANGITRRFTLNLADGSKVITKRLEVQYSEPLSETRATIWGDTTIKGDLNLGKAPDVTPLMPLDARGLHFGTPYPTPEKAAPWRLYRTEFTPKDAPPGTKPIHQLRLEIFNPGEEGDEAGYGFSIGHWHSKTDKEGDYQPCLRVTANCTVALAGELKVAEAILQSPVPADPQDPRFIEALIAKWVEAVSKTSSRLDVNYNGKGNVLSSDLEIDFTYVQDAAKTDEEINYSFSLTNKGNSLFGSVQIMVFALLPDGKVLIPEPVGSPIPILKPNTSVDLKKPPTIKADKNNTGVLSIGVFATAIAIDGKVLVTPPHIAKVNITQ